MEKRKTNAFNELFGLDLSAKEYQELLTYDEFNDQFEVEENNGHYFIAPSWGSNKLKEELAKIRFAIIHYNYYDDPDGSKICTLRSERTLQDEELFCNILKSINYYAGYGTQQLFGVVVYNDGSWLSRGEYDGSEWWTLNKCPIEEEVFEDEY